jgi:hypothetical protein
MDVQVVRRIAAALPGTEDASTAERLAFWIAGRGYAWSYLRREHPKKPRTPCLEVLAVRCPIERKELLIEAAPELYFDDDHYRGYPALLVRLEAIGEPELAALLADAHAWQASLPPKRKKKA